MSVQAHSETSLTLVVRQIREDDLPTVVRLFDEGMTIGVDAIYHAPLAKYVAEAIKADLASIESLEAEYITPGGNFWVATLDDLVVGMVGIEPKGDQRGEVRRLAVDAAYHRRGIARQLMAHAEAWATTHGFTVLTLGTGEVRHQARRLYEGLGYKHTGTHTLFEEPHYDEFEYTKNLEI